MLHDRSWVGGGRAGRRFRGSALRARVQLLASVLLFLAGCATGVERPATDDESGGADGEGAGGGSGGSRSTRHGGAGGVASGAGGSLNEGGAGEGGSTGSGGTAGRPGAGGSAAGGVTGSGGSTRPATGGASGAPRYVPEAVNNVFANCVFCHPGTADKEFDFYYVGLYDRLLSPEPDTHIAATCAFKRLIVPGKPEESLVYLKLLATPPPNCGVRMPKGKPAVTAGELKTLKDWITAGAPSSPTP